ncbi:ATP-dependent DNA helicase [Paxillus ammoniavirescens]|nr:ATP-dependent DNA helicase [Paxillus ammoniavirescens]
MAVSDSSSTTLGTLVTMNASANSTEETAIPIDSPVMVELDLDDASGATLAVPDSDDKLYDMFDPISPEDIPLLTAEKPQAPSPSTPASGSSSASTSTTVGRIDHTASPYYKEVITILKTTFKLSTFRTNQLECIVATLDGKDVFYLAPTGGGKSLCFQLPALCVTGKTQGTTFVISPLISLITDQVSALRSKGVNAWCLTSAAEENEVREVMRMMRSSVGEKPKLVYTTPERLQKSDCLKDVVNQLYEEKQLARFVVDEAHVIGSWGRDFRASYAELKVLRKSWPGVPIMALTGSANKDAIEDIKRNLAMQNPICLAQSFNRPNLHYEVRKKPAQKKNLVQAIAGFIKSQHSADTGIIYCLSRAESEEMAQKLREDFGLEARHYHAGINNEERKNNQDDWMAGRCKIIVATVAFGMGIDKPDVRFVIHAALSKDMDGYYQETGRAGRDGQPSDCILFYTWNDAVKLEKMIRNPNTNDPSRGAPDETEIDRQISKLQAVVAYCSNESDCRRVLLLRHFDEEFKPENCHKQCDNCCRPGTLVRHDFTAEAQQVIRLLEEMIAVNSRGVTQGQVIDTWKGKNGKNVQQYKGVSLYAAGKALDHTTVDRILNNLVAEKMISLYRVVSSSGYSNNYIQVGSAGQECLDGHRPFVVAWKEMDGGNQNFSRSSNKPAPSKKPNHFPSLASGDEPAAVAGGKDDIETLRLERLREKRRWLSERFGRVEETVLQDDTLQMMALMPPEDEAAFRHIVAECEDPNSVNDKWNMFGKDFLDALRPQHPTVGPSSRKAFDATRMRQDFEFNG